MEIWLIELPENERDLPQGMAGLSKSMEGLGLRGGREFICRYDSWSYKPRWMCDCGEKCPESGGSKRVECACAHCGGALKIIAAILEKAAITKILDHLGLPARAPPRAPAQIFDPFEPTWSRARSFQSSSSLGWPLPLGVFRLKRQNAAKSLNFCANWTGIQ